MGVGIDAVEDVVRNHIPGEGRARDAPEEHAGDIGHQEPTGKWGYCEGRARLRDERRTQIHHARPGLADPRWAANELNDLRQAGRTVGVLNPPDYPPTRAKGDVEGIQHDCVNDGDGPRPVIDVGIGRREGLLRAWPILWSRAVAGLPVSLSFDYDLYLIIHEG